MCVYVYIYIYSYICICVYVDISYNIFPGARMSQAPAPTWPGFSR